MLEYRVVEYQDYVLVEGKWTLQLAGKARFHSFGVDYEEFESGPGNFSTAILELSTGGVKMKLEFLILLATVV